MRILYIAAVLGTLAHPAWAIPFLPTDCSALALNSLGAVSASKIRLREAVDMLHKILLSRGFQILVIELDWLLWQRAEQMKDCIPFRS